jgi:hypothetical protein
VVVALVNRDLITLLLMAGRVAMELLLLFLERLLFMQVVVVEVL